MLPAAVVIGTVALGLSARPVASIGLRAMLRPASRPSWPGSRC